ncbi:hypothetical protein HN748_06120 [Candidatus Peregrinibacteria bacterium]|nr:hypothetical protein [Candidatus Peregrinibacteria bacterium]
MNNNIDEINQYLSSVTAAAGNLPKEKIAELAAMILKAYEEEKTIFVFGNEAAEPMPPILLEI